jgi:quercetin dioxygenase-like cupin family protein
MKKIGIIVLGVFFAGFFISCNENIKQKDSKEVKTVENVEDEKTVHDSMIIVKVAETSIAETPHGVDVRKVYENTHAQVMIIMLNPGESLKPHITPVDVFFYVLEGTVDVMVGDEIKSVSADCLVESPKDIKHNLSNNSESVARIMVVKVPKPTSSSTLL